jgi:hypothetical protein
MVFVDGIVLTRKFKPDSIPVLCGMRSMAYLEPGDVDRDGKTVVELTALGERLYTAWIQGSHDSKLQMASDGTTLSLKGNPGRFGRRDNLFNLGFDETLAAANRIAEAQGFPAGSFIPGTASPYTASQLASMNLAKDEVPEQPYEVEKNGSGARVWSIHLTQNYSTGGPDNAKAIIEWLNTQSVARVKKSRLGLSTIVWGSIRYCQTEIYVKADEMLAHCRSPEERETMRNSEAYKYAFVNGIIRLEVKCAKDFLKHRKLTYLGNWDMGTVTALFKEKSEILDRAHLSFASDDELLESLPSRLRVHAAAWLQGVDVTKLMSRATLFRHAKALRGYGIDIAEPRNVSVLRPKWKEITVQAVEAPDWYSLAAA